MRVPVVVALAVVLAGCSGGSDATSQDPVNPIYSGEQEGPEAHVNSSKTVYADPWGNLTSRQLLTGTVNWHDDPDAFRNTYDRATQPVANPCAYGNEVYFNNAWLGSVKVWNFTSRIEVVLEWDPLSYTRDMLRVGYDNGEGTFVDSPPGRSGQTIIVKVEQTMWARDPRSFGGNIAFAACPDDYRLDGVPPYFEGELRYKITAFK